MPERTVPVARALPPQRHLFDIPAEIAYFNCASNSPQLNDSRARLHFGVDTKSRPWERTPQSFFQDAETIRRLSSGLFGGAAEGYAIVAAASYGISTAARAIEPHLRPGDRILVVAEEFPSNVLPWRRVAQGTGAVLETVPAPEHGTWARAILDRIDKHVKVVAVSTCHWTNGARIDLVPIGAACRDVGSALVVDATQSLGAMPLSVDEVQPDFLVAAGYKWLLCPYGFGLLYVSERWRDARPLEETWLARDNARNFAALSAYSDSYMPGARRFDVGETCTPTILPGAIAALEQIQAWGVDSIAASLSATNHRIAGSLEQLGFRLPDPSQRCPHLLGARTPPHWPDDLVAPLKEKNVFISRRAHSIRIAPHLHITASDTDRLLEALHQLVP
jgi:selenocysteine lyase/cysteine desulfurase